MKTSLAMCENFSHCTYRPTSGVASVFKTSPLLRHHLHKIKCTSLKCIDHAFFKCILLCEHHHDQGIEHSGHPTKVPCATVWSIHSPQPLATTETFFHYRLPCPRFPPKWYHGVWTLTSASFISYFWDSTTLPYVEGVQSFSLQSMIPLCGYITVHLPTHLFVDRWPYWKFLTMRINVHDPVWTCMFISLGVNLLGQRMLHSGRNCQTGCTILHV